MLTQQIFLVILFAFYDSNAIYVDNNQSGRSSSDTLVFAHMLARHGDRNVREAGVYPTDPWHDPSNWPGGFDQLTTLGIQTSYEIGKYLRKRYQTLIGNRSYSDELVYFQSTDVSRVMNSASAAAAGLFPLSPEQRWNPELNWFPIPIHTIPKKLDYILYAERPCDRYDRAFRKYHESREYKEEIGKLKNLIQYLETHSGVMIGEDLGPLHFLYDTLWIEDLKNKTLPGWARAVFGPGTEFERASNRYFQIYTATPELSRLTYGFFIRDVLDRCAEVIKGTLSPNRSLWLYFAHDTTIASVLNLLGLYDHRQPPYSSSLFFDLYKTPDNKFYLQLSYKNSSDSPTLLSFPHCGTKCSLEELEEIYKESVPNKSFEEECQLSLFVKAIHGDICSHDVYIFVIAGLIIALVIAVIVSWCTCNRKHMYKV